METVDEHQQGPGDGVAEGRLGADGAVAIEPLVSQLRSMITQLSAARPDPSDGSGWLTIDTALAGLHGALVALVEFDRGS